MVNVRSVLKSSSRLWKRLGNAPHHCGRVDAGNRIGLHSEGQGPGLKVVEDPETIQMGGISALCSTLYSRVIWTGAGYAGGSRLVT